VELEYVVAADLDHAWLNFELDLPLETGPKGQPNPFYVGRPDSSLAELEQALLAPFYELPKHFLSGHRGCGKSTELRHLAANPEIRAKFWPVQFSIRDEADVNSLDYRDVLLAIGGQLYRQYHAGGGRLPGRLLSELDQFRGQVEKEVMITPRRVTEGELEGRLDAFFGQAGLKLKLEPKVRTAVRQVIEHDITGLIDLLDTMSAAIQGDCGRWPLMLIDDLDKPDVSKAREVFHHHRAAMLQPRIAVVYTVASPFRYVPEFEAICVLPSVKLHAHDRPDELDTEGYRTMRAFVHKRMRPDLIADAALDELIRTSGGLFREMCRLARYAIGHARVKGASQIQLEDVERAGAEIRREYRRMLSTKQLQLLKEVHLCNRLEDPDELGPLMQILAVLEYHNDENWWDVLPVLEPLLEGLDDD
jgi:hypothetical protein